MIENRILDLLTDGELLQKEDIVRLSAGIQKYPYMQSLHALKMLAANKFEADNYPGQLATTAAYTTDKKILYRLVNKNHPFKIDSEAADIQDEESNKNMESNHSEPTNTLEEVLPETVINNFEIQNHPAPRISEDIEHVEVNGEINRILFPGEEDFLDRDTPKIDYESTREAGVLVVNNVEDASQETEQNRILDFQEKLKNIAQNSDSRKSDSVEPTLPESGGDVDEKPQDDKFNNVKNPVANEVENNDLSRVDEQLINNKVNSGGEFEKSTPDQSQLSYHKTDDFLPNISINPAKEAASPLPQSRSSNRHEEERLRLIAEVEAKMKTIKKPLKTADIGAADEPESSNAISFAETMDSVVASDNQDVVLDIADSNSEGTDGLIDNDLNIVEEDSAKFIADSQVESSWKPMGFAMATPDSLVNIGEAGNLSKKEIISEKMQDTEAVQVPEDVVSEGLADSNVPKFINTWQSWLKLDITRAEPGSIVEKIAPSTEAVKNQAIEKFIENEPKISRLSEDSSFVVRERSGDISHLMTETLANIYVEQRLYTKAVAAFEILKGKFPARTVDFDRRIQEIRELRQPK